MGRDGAFNGCGFFFQIRICSDRDGPAGVGGEMYRLAVIGIYGIGARDGFSSGRDGRGVAGKRARALLIYIHTQSRRVGA